MPTPEANQPDSPLPTTSMAPTASPNPTSAANKQPHDRWQYVNLIPTPTVTLPEQPYTPPQFPSPIGGTPRNRRSKTPPRATTPTRTRQQDPRTGSPTPHRTAPTTTSQQYHTTVRPLPKRPPPSLYQAQPAATTEPLQPVPPATGCFQGGSYTPTPTEAPPQTSAPSPNTATSPHSNTSKLVNFGSNLPSCHAPPSHRRGGPAGAPPASVPPRHSHYNLETYSGLRSSHGSVARGQPLNTRRLTLRYPQCFFR